MKTLLLALAAFATTTAAAGPVGIGQHQRIGRFVVTPIRVDEDSRCPMNARCVWAGRLTVSAMVRDDRQHTSRLHHFTLGEPARSGLVLDSVTPDRVAGGPQRALRYRFHFSAAAIGR